jgi:hypothetical protein
VRPDILRWAATNRSAAGGSHGDQQVFDTDGVFFDKAELLETMVAGATLRPVDDAFTLDIMLQQLGVRHRRLQICTSPAAYLFCELVVNDSLRIEVQRLIAKSTSSARGIAVYAKSGGGAAPRLN